MILPVFVPIKMVPVAAALVLALSHATYNSAQMGSISKPRKKDSDGLLFNKNLLFLCVHACIDVSVNMTGSK